MQQALLIKAGGWDHEKEYRFIDLPGASGRPGILDPPIALERLGPQLVRMPQSTPTGCLHEFNQPTSWRKILS